MKALQQTIDRLFELYGLRNAMCLRGDMRAMVLHDQVRSFCKKIRKGVTNKKSLVVSLSGVFSRTIAYADSFVNLPLVTALAEKYPLTGCAYCNHSPCECALDRTGNITLAKVSGVQLHWTIEEWIAHLDMLYGTNNRSRGIDAALLRLIEEMHEAEGAHLFDNAFDINVDLATRRLNVAREFADVLAWIFSIAGMLDLDLGNEIEERYGNVCERCHERPCNCGSLILDRRYQSNRSEPTRTTIGEE